MSFQHSAPDNTALTVKIKYDLPLFSPNNAVSDVVLIDYSLSGGLVLVSDLPRKREFRYVNVSNPSSCRVRYTQSAAINTEPTILLTTSGC